MTHAWRLLWKAPRATLVIVLTLGLGIGLVTTVFSLLNGYLWRPLPYPGAERVVALAEVQRSSSLAGRIGELPWAAYQALQEQTASYQPLAAYRARGANLRVGELARRLNALHATPSLLPLLGVSVYFGRGFEPGDAAAGAAPVALLTHRYWRTQFGEDRAVLSRVVSLDGRAVTIVGVLPRDFEFEYADVWLPLSEVSNGESIHVLGRLRANTSRESARFELVVLEPRLRQAGLIQGTLLLHPEMVVRLPIPAGLHWLFLIATIFVLAIACANIVNLLLARGVIRRAEYAVRVSLGASRARLLRDGLAESAVLVLLAAPIGLVLSAWTIDLLLVTVPNNIPSWLDFGIDLRVLGFATLLAAATVAMIGIVPAREAARVDLLTALKMGGIVGAGSVRRTRRLIVLEIALAVALFMGTLLMVRSARLLGDVDPGYDAGRVLAVRFGLDDRYLDAARQRSFFERMMERMRRQPGVEAVSTQSKFQSFISDPDSSARYGVLVALAGATNPPVHYPPFNVVEPAFAGVLGLRVMQGRFFDGGDRAGTERVVVLSQSLARRLAPAGDAVGRLLALDSAGSRTARVIGVLQDRVSIRFARNGARAEPEAEVYLAAAQSNAQTGWTELLIRGSPVSTFPRLVQQQLQAVDPDQALLQAETLAERLHQSGLATRVFAALLGIVAGCAFLLALIGLYGVVSYSAEQRRSEIGLRVALGATRRDIGRQVIGYGLGLASAGVSLGLGLGFALNRLTRVLLFGVSTLDPLTCALVAIVFAAVALLAACAPARRAMQVDPLSALRAH